MKQCRSRQVSQQQLVGCWWEYLTKGLTPEDSAKLLAVTSDWEPAMTPAQFSGATTITSCFVSHHSS
jgi:hypothetical protein